MDTNEKLIRDVKLVLSDLEELFSHLKTNASSELAEVQETANKKIEAAKLMLMTSEQDLLTKEKVAVEMTDSFARSNTWKIIAIVAVISFLIGYTMR